MDPPDWVVALRRSACQQALFYRDNPERFEQYAGQYIFLRQGEVAWSGADPHGTGRIMEMSGYNMQQAVWLKLVDPEDREQERYAAYEEVLPGLA